MPTYTKKTCFNAAKKRLAQAAEARKQGDLARATLCLLAAEYWRRMWTHNRYNRVEAD